MKYTVFSKVYIRPQHTLLLIFLFILSCSKDEPMEIDEEEPSSGPVVYPPYTLPLVSVDTYNQEIPDEPKIPGIMQVSDRGNELFQGPIGIERRGQSSQSFPKKQYGLETKDASNQDLDVSILDMPLEEDWILYAPYSDKSLMRNVLAYDIARSMGRYASRTQFVNMKLNGLNQGIYVFMEKLKRDDNRININKLKPDENEGEDVTGGYIIKI
ncbi:MAG: CotH kinase family protein, partial [Flavobacteriaceae bacterium]